MITVMVLVMPGIAPPITPIRVPMASGRKYFKCSRFWMPSRRSSYILEIRPAPARQQDLQVALEEEVAHHRGDDRGGSDHPPALGAARRLERALQAGEK